MADIKPLVGTKIYIGDPTWDHATLTGYDGQTSGWTEVGTPTSLPPYGIEFAEGSATTLGGETKYWKTAANYGTGAMGILLDGEDDGQGALKAAAADKVRSYPMKIELADKPAGATSKPTRDYFRALVMSFRNDGGDVSGADRATVNLRIVTEPIRGAVVVGS